MKHERPRLSLNRETLRQLSDSNLRRAAGGTIVNTVYYPSDDWQCRTDPCQSNTSPPVQIS